MICQQPVEGLFGFMAFRNESKLELEQKLQVEMEDAEVVWPKEARGNAEFIMNTPPGDIGMILFRKKTSEIKQVSTVQYTLPPILSEEKLSKMCRMHGEKELFEEGKHSYY